MTGEDIADLAAELVLERVVWRLHQQGAVNELRIVAGMSASEVDVLIDLERRGFAA